MESRASPPVPPPYDSSRGHGTRETLSARRNRNAGVCCGNPGTIFAGSGPKVPHVQGSMDRGYMAVNRRVAQRRPVDWHAARGLHHRYDVGRLGIHRGQSHGPPGVQRTALGGVDRAGEKKARSSGNFASELAAGRVFSLLRRECRLVRLPRCRVQTVDQGSGRCRHGPDHPDGSRSIRSHQARVGVDGLPPDSHFCAVHQVLPRSRPGISPLDLDALLHRCRDQ